MKRRRHRETIWRRRRDLYNTYDVSTAEKRMHHREVIFTSLFH